MRMGSSSVTSPLVRLWESSKDRWSGFRKVREHAQDIPVGTINVQVYNHIHLKKSKSFKSKVHNRGKGNSAGQGKGGTKNCNDSGIGSCVRASVTEARVTVYVCVHMPRKFVCERKVVNAYCNPGNFCKRLIFVLFVNSWNLWKSIAY